MTLSAQRLETAKRTDEGFQHIHLHPGFVEDGAKSLAPEAVYLLPWSHQAHLTLPIQLPPDSCPYAWNAEAEMLAGSSVYS